MSSISQMERSSSQTRMLATQPPFCRSRCEWRRRSRLQHRCSEVFSRGSTGSRSFCVEPPQPQNESGSLPLLRPCPDLAFVRLYDLVDHRQTKARAAFEVRLEGLENLLRLLRGHAGSGIRETNLPVVFHALDRHLQSAAVPHGANRILADIPENLFDSVPVGEHPRFRNGKPALNRDAGILDRKSTRLNSS